ncbi:hypothetical protein ABMY26_36600 (plasmid) [Azospirillum sp. HJ39]|uniref:DUF4376 domain-containing protein n=1 Tax=Azospirillum sp. HJ39 TaxID=3159496 RepID=UPI0035580CC6
MPASASAWPTAAAPTWAAWRPRRGWCCRARCLHGPKAIAQGWIAIDNTRLPLPGPVDGIALAAAVGIAYSAIVQHARDLKDAAQASDDPTVDELSGWPG